MGMYVHPTRLFQTPDDLLQAWNNYKESLEAESQRWKKIQYVGKDGDKKSDPQKVPYTFEGFKRYCRIHHGEVEQYFTNQDGYYAEFIGVCRAIKEEIREDQIIGGLLGFYNPSITQRLNGLVEKQQITEDVNMKAEIKIIGSDAPPRASSERDVEL